MIMPLITLVVGTGQDEKQLSDKAQGLLKSRIGKLKEVPVSIDEDDVVKVLSDVHARARKVHSSDTLATISQCSIYISRILLHHGHEDAVLEAYRTSLSDFATRKASPLNSNFFLDFIRRHVDAAWGLRGAILEVQNRATNSYRKCQIFLLLQPIIKSQPVCLMSDHLNFLLTSKPEQPSRVQCVHEVISGGTKLNLNRSMCRCPDLECATNEGSAEADT
jgi:DNA polymerase phi